MNIQLLLRHAICACLFILSQAVYAAVFNIPNGDVTSLKAALVAANGNGQADTINLAAGGTYTLTTIDNSSNGANGLPVIVNDAAGLDLTINGNGATIQRNAEPGAPEFRILQIGNGAEANCNSLTIKSGKVANGVFPGNAGAAILVSLATLTLTDCGFSNNIAGLGGAICNDAGSVMLNGGAVVSNTAGQGGGVYNFEGSLDVRSSTFEQNVVDDGANGLGGAIANIRGTLALATSTLRANRSDKTGGALYNSGTATLMNSAVNENVASGAGGGIANDGELTLLDSQLNLNQSNNLGGGMHTTGTATIERCEVNENKAIFFAGGGISNFGVITVESSTFNGNNGGRGGAISTFANNPSIPSGATLRNSTFSNNGATQGGAISNFASTLTLLNSTVSGNIASVRGGGVHNINGIADVRSDTFSGNSAMTGGGILNQTIVGQPGVPATLTIQSTILQAGEDGGNLLNLGATVISDGFNLSSDAAGGDGNTFPGGLLSGEKDIRNRDSNLGPLQDNGGRTATHALLVPSPAIDSGDDSILAPPLSLATDQRGTGFPRRNGLHVDRGAFEFGGISPPVLSAVSRKLHGAIPFDINLPLTGNVGIDCRSSGGSNDYQLVITFASPVAVSGSPQATVISGSATIGTGGLANGGSVSVSGPVVTVPLTNVTNAQRIEIKLTSVTDGTNIGDLVIPMSILIGDTTGNGSVNASDVSQTKLQSGQAVTGSNFRSDVTVNGSINASDVGAVKSKSGTALEAAPASKVPR
jgi:hypothetical protein